MPLLKVGVTGGIGSGKSLVCRMFSVLGVPVYDADAEAKKLMVTDVNLVSALTNAFGEEIYAGGELQRKLLSQKVFNNEKALQKLNSLVHPVVIRHAENWFNQLAGFPYAIKEAALFFESGSAGEMDFVIGVWAHDTLRLHRVMQRDGADRLAVKARMDKQIEETLRMKLCDAVINNDGQQALLPQVQQMHQRLLAMALTNN